MSREHYNTVRLHQGVGYVTPDDDEGRGEAIRQAAKLVSNKPGFAGLPDTEPSQKIQPSKDPPMLFDSQQISIAKSETPQPDVSGIGEAATSHLSHQSSTDEPDAPGSMLAHHFQGNVQGSTNSSPNPAPPPTSLIQTLENALEHEKAVLGKTYDDLKALFQPASTLTLVQILKELVGIVAGAALRSAQVVVDALFDFLYVVATKLIEYLDTPVHFPVISDILNAIGIPDFSILDVM